MAWLLLVTLHDLQLSYVHCEFVSDPNQHSSLTDSASRLKTADELKITLARTSRRSMRKRMADARASYIPTLKNLALGPTH